MQNGVLALLASFVGFSAPLLPNFVFVSGADMMGVADWAP